MCAIFQVRFEAICAALAGLTWGSSAGWRQTGLDISAAPRIYSQRVMKPKGYGTKTAERLDVTFAALADSTRREILARLAKGEASVMELAAAFAMSQPAISK